MAIKKIGGEFEIDINWIKEFGKDPLVSQIHYMSGRTALKVILEQIKKNLNQQEPTIHIPYLICNSVYKTCQQSNYQIKFYEPTTNFIIPSDYLKKISSHEVVLTVNYFGFVCDNDCLESIKKTIPSAVTISDRVHDYYRASNSIADYSFTSFRKFFPTIGGAEIKTHNKITVSHNSTLDNFYLFKLIGLIIKSMNPINDSYFLDLLQLGEKHLDTNDKIVLAPQLVDYLMNECIDIKNIQDIRRQNARFAYEYGKEKGIRFIFDKLPLKSTPLVIPVKVGKNLLLRDYLKDKKIYLPIHWPIEEYNQHSKISSEMSTMGISLIIDQRYTEEDIKHQIDCILEFENR